MTNSTTFTSLQAETLRAFLAAPERPAGTLSYPELAGFLFAICCSPEMVSPSEWLPVIFGDKDAGYKDEQEAQQVLVPIMELYNYVNQGVRDKQPALPPQCEASRVVAANLEPDAPFGQWARGFGMGADYLSEVWDAHTPQEMDEDLGSCMMVLTFFASRGLAEAYRAEMNATDRSLEEFATQMIGLFPEALHQYVLIGSSIAEVLQKKSRPAPARSTKIGRNDPCPCGSGKKYKQCCGVTLH